MISTVAAAVKAVFVLFFLVTSRSQLRLLLLLVVRALQFRGLISSVYGALFLQLRAQVDRDGLL